MANRQGYDKEYYAKNRERRLAQIKHRKNEMKKYVHNLKLQHSCKYCGENHPAALDFHHRDPEQKELSINDVIKAGWSFDRLVAEIEKCDIICANCHRKLHYEERE